MQKNLSTRLVWSVLAMAVAFSSPQAVRLTIHNEDVGPVTDERFMRDQRWAVRNLVSLERPGSGLFWLGGRYYHHLGEIVASINIWGADQHLKRTLPSPDIITAWTHQNDRSRLAPYCLPLPGKSLAVEIGDLAPDDKVHVKLWSWNYNFSQRAGWVFKKTPDDTWDLSADTLVPRSEEGLLPMVCRYPAAKPTLVGMRRLLTLTPAPERYTFPFPPHDLQANWKEVTDGPLAAPLVYPTDGFNTEIKGTVGPADLWGLGAQFERLAGHPLSHSPYTDSKRPSES